MPTELQLEELATLGAQQGESFQKDSRALDKAWRTDKLAEMVNELKERAIADGNRFDNPDA